MSRNLWITGPAGSGKSTLARCLTDSTDLSVIEVGVLVRLAAKLGGGLAPRHCATLLHRYVRRGRLDFDAASTLKLAAVSPRLDGRALELPLWSELTPDRVREVAADEEIETVLRLITMRELRAGRRIIVSRQAFEVPELSICEVHLTAAAAVRASRKSRQVAPILGLSNMASYDPPSLRASSAEFPGAVVVDTTCLSPSNVSQLVQGSAARHLSGPRESGAVLSA